MHVVARLNNRLNAAAGDSELYSGLFVSELCEDLQACARNEHFQIECRAESHDIALTAAVPLGLIINDSRLTHSSMRFLTSD